MLTALYEMGRMAAIGTAEAHPEYSRTELYSPQVMEMAYDASPNGPLWGHDDEADEQYPLEFKELSLAQSGEYAKGYVDALAEMTLIESKTISRHDVVTFNGRQGVALESSHGMSTIPVLFTENGRAWSEDIHASKLTKRSAK